MKSIATWTAVLCFLLATTGCKNTNCTSACLGPEQTQAPPAKNLIDPELTDWKPINFGGEGEVSYKDDALNLDVGILTGVQYTGDIKKVFGEALENYEITLQAKRVEGMDIFLGLTFPVGTDGNVSLVLGGWAGVVNGISSLNGMNASENATTTYKKGGYTDGQWYNVRVRVTAEKIECWLDDKQIVDAKREDFDDFDTHQMVTDTKPFGLFTYETWGAYRDLKVRRLQ